MMATGAQGQAPPRRGRFVQGRDISDLAGAAAGLRTEQSEEGRPVTVIIVARNELIRRGLVSIVEHGLLRVLAECLNLASALDFLKDQPSDVTVVDLDSVQPSSDRKSMGELAERSNLVVVASDLESPEVIDAMFAGARGCLLRSASVEVFLAEVRVAAEGQRFIAGSMAEKLLELARGERQVVYALSAIQQKLSGREIDVLMLVAQGLDNAAIGAKLYISPHTVKNHIANVLDKLGLENRTQAAVWAARSGLTSDSFDGAR